MRRHKYVIIAYFNEDFIRFMELPYDIYFADNDKDLRHLIASIDINTDRYRDYDIYKNKIIII